MRRWAGSIWGCRGRRGRTARRSGFIRRDHEVFAKTGKHGSTLNVQGPFWPAAIVRDRFAVVRCRSDNSKMMRDLFYGVSEQDKAGKHRMEDARALLKAGRWRG